MKIVGIGDALIPEAYIKKGFREIEKLGVEVNTIQWKLQNYEELQNINLSVENQGSEAYEPPQYILDELVDADVIITQFCTITRRTIDYCKKLKIIGVLRSGCENVNIVYANQKGILVLNTPGRNANAVADFAVGMLISECRNIAKSHLELKKGNWVRDFANADYVPDLPEKTVGIVGFGEIGRKVAKRLAGFEMNIIAYDPFVKDPGNGVKMVSLAELMQQSDFVTIHARLTKDTEKLISRELIYTMKPTAYLINTARSGLVDETALCQALKEKRIAGAALDVFDVEPPGKDYPIVCCDNVTITPHLAGGTKDAFTSSPKLLAQEMIKLWQNQEPRSIVNKNTYKNFQMK
jgi:D-3-phosphoglycerate dehydrogenase